MRDDTKKLSKFLSLILRHQPDKIGLTLDAQGWAVVDELIRLVSRSGRPLSREILDRIVAANDKQRFAFSDDGLRIRASQGHSISVDLHLPPRQPPDVLYHGTATRYLDSIMTKGLLPGRRQHVHLSPDASTAMQVGRRHGKPVILTVQAGVMHDQGALFYLSDNGVWLTDAAPPTYLSFLDSDTTA